MMAVELALVAPGSFAFRVSDEQLTEDREVFRKRCKQAWFVLAALNWLVSSQQSYTWPYQEMILFVPEPKEIA